MANSSTPPKPAQGKNPGKNRIWKIREKSGYKNPSIFGQILDILGRNGLICEEKLK